MLYEHFTHARYSVNTQEMGDSGSIMWKHTMLLILHHSDQQWQFLMVQRNVNGIWLQIQ